MKTSYLHLFHWLPRVFCILSILFVSIFSLDAFAPGYSIWQQIGSFLVHLIPSFVLLAILILAWKWELYGGILFTMIGIGLSPFVFNLNHLRNQFSVIESLGIVMMITFPFILVGILFLISYKLKKQNREVVSEKAPGL